MFIANPTQSSNKRDIWGLGCILYEIVAEEPGLFVDLDIRAFALSEGPFVFPTSRIHTEDSSMVHVASEMVKAMTNKEFAKRPSGKTMKSLFAYYRYHSTREDTKQLARGCGTYRRILRELKDFLQNPLPGIAGGPVDDNLFLYHFNVEVLEESSPYYGGTFVCVC